MRKPEPYKGKGIRYQGEYVRRKVGKRSLMATVTVREGRLLPALSDNDCRPSTPLPTFRRTYSPW